MPRYEYKVVPAPTRGLKGKGIRGGNVNITETAEEFDLAARPDVDPSLQNHCVEGRIEWLDNGVPVPTTVLIPTTPVNGASATQATSNPHQILTISEELYGIVGSITSQFYSSA